MLCTFKTLIIDGFHCSKLNLFCCFSHFKLGYLLRHQLSAKKLENTLFGI